MPRRQRSTDLTYRQPPPSPSQGRSTRSQLNPAATSYYPTPLQPMAPPSRPSTASTVHPTPLSHPWSEPYQLNPAAADYQPSPLQPRTSPSRPSTANTVRPPPLSQIWSTPYQISPEGAEYEPSSLAEAYYGFSMAFPGYYAPDAPDDVTLRGPINDDEMQALAILKARLGPGDRMTTTANLLSSALFVESLENEYREDQRNGRDKPHPYLFGPTQCQQAWDRLNLRNSDGEVHPTLEKVRRMRSLQDPAIKCVSREIDDYNTKRKRYRAMVDSFYKNEGEVFRPP